METDSRQFNFNNLSRKGNMDSKSSTQQQSFSELLKSRDFDLVNPSKLKIFLAHYHQYPTDYRHLIWKILMKLPENSTIFKELEKSKSPIHTDFSTLFPLKSKRDAKHLQKYRILIRIINCLCNWSPGLENVDYLPMIVFPFTKIMHNDDTSVFETVATILTNWCQHWFGIAFCNTRLFAVSTI